MEQGLGSVDSLNVTAGENCTDSTFYSVFDVTAFGVSSPYPRLYKTFAYDQCSGSASSMETIPLYTVIVIADKGIVSAITWDDGCLACADNGPNCIYNAVDVNTSQVYRGDIGLRGCYEDAATCAPTPIDTSALPNATNYNFTSSPCDLKVFVTWTGTDRNGAFFTSAGERLSRYTSFGVGSLYQGVLNGIDAGTAIFNTALNGGCSVHRRGRRGGGVWEKRKEGGGGHAVNRKCP